MRVLASSMCLLGLAIVGCGQNSQGKAEPRPLEVLVTEAISDSITDYEEFTGRTESKNMVAVKARVQGYLDKVHFTDGQMVKEGQLLFEIDSRLYKAEFQRTEAALAQSQAKLERLEKDYQRAFSLLPSKGISQEEFDKVKGDRAEAEAAVGVARAELRKAEQNFDFTKVTVPTLNGIGNDGPMGESEAKPRLGRVGRRLVDPGNLVKADETLLTTIVTLDPMYVYFDIDERTALRLRTLAHERKIKSIGAMTFRFGLADEEGKFPYEGRTDFEDNKIDSGTGTLQLRGEFKNDKKIAPGSFVRVRLFLGTPRQTVLVPERALGTDQGQKYLYVVKKETGADGQTEYKADYRGGDALQLGALRDGWRVIEKGVAKGEWVVWSGLQRIRKDAKISPKLQEPPQPKPLNGP